MFSGYNIRIKKVDNIVELQEILTLKPKVNPEFNDDNVIVPVFRVNDKYINVPRYYGETILKDKYDYILNLTIPKSININFNGQVRDYQVPIIDECVNRLNDSNGVILSVPCGKGKTLMSIITGSKLKLKILVVVHKTFLQDQWIDRIKTFTDAKIGIIRQKQVEIEDKDIVIGMLQSLCMIDYTQTHGDIFEGFGLVIFDECHRVGSKELSKVLFKTSGIKNRIGLSATPDRSDGMTELIQWHIGPIYAPFKDAPVDSNAIVNVFNYTSTDEKLFKEEKRFIKGDIKVSSQTMITNIVNIEARNNFIVNILNVLRLKTDRKILILSDRIEHLNTLKTKLDDIIKLDEYNDCNTFYYYGKCTKLERQEAELNGDIIFGTFAMAQEGLDIDKLNTILLITPKSSIVQAIGRIFRKKCTDVRNIPMIIDFVDMLSIFPNQFRKRNKVYKDNNYKIMKHEVTDDELDYGNLEDILVNYNTKINGENRETGEKKFIKKLNYADLDF